MYHQELKRFYVVGAPGSEDPKLIIPAITFEVTQHIQCAAKKYPLKLFAIF